MNIPAGYKLVPEKATQEWFDTLVSKYGDPIEAGLSKEEIFEFINSMIEAAPCPK